MDLGAGSVNLIVPALCITDGVRFLSEIGGTTQLGTEEFDPDKVALEFGTPVNGKLKFTASPKDKTAKSFFMKMNVK